jgi:sec-independent protein translocase protein TatB
MFGLSWGQIAIILLVGVFVLGPERIPTAVTWVLTSLRKLRTMAAGAQAELRREIGPEIDELRRQVADLQSLKELQELRDLRDLHPKRLIGKNILGDEFSGGITGFLGLNEPLPGTNGAATSNGATTNGAATTNGSAGPAGAPVTNGAAAPTPPHLPPSMVKSSSAQSSSAQPSMARPSSAQPSVTKLAAPKVVGSMTPPRPAVVPGERPPFDPDGT